MPDFLTHILVVYVVLALAGQRLDWLTPPWIVAGMAGGLIPDVSKLELVVSADMVEAVLGVPFSWFPLTTLPGSVLVAGLASLAVAAEYRVRTFGILVFGAMTHLGLDLLLQKPGPTTFPVLYPVTLWEPPVVGVYLSSDVWPSLVAVGLAGVVFVLTRDR